MKKQICKQIIHFSFIASILAFAGIHPAFATPGGISGGLELWLKADAGTSTTTDGQDLAAWADQSGARTRTAQAVGGDGETRPSFKNNVIDQINFNPVVEFNGTSNGLSFFNDFIFSSGRALHSLP